MQPIFMEPPKKGEWYYQTFEEEWVKDPEFKEWLQQDTKSKDSSYCKCCNVMFQNANRSTLMQHKESAEHKRNYQCSKSEALENYENNTIGISSEDLEAKNQDAEVSENQSPRASSEPEKPFHDIKSNVLSGQTTIIAQKCVVSGGQMTTSDTGCSSTLIVNMSSDIDSAKSKAAKDAELRVLQFINRQSYINTRDELATTFKAAQLSPTALKVFPQIAENSHFYHGDHAVKDIAGDTIQVAEYIKDRKFCFQNSSGDISRSYEDVFKMIETVNAEEVTPVILLVAQAGAGKTVGMKRWARSILERSKITPSDSFASDSRFHLVLFKSFKSIQHKESTNLQEILFGGCCENSHDAELIYNWAVKNDFKVSIFIDGLDQAPWTIEEKHFEQDLEPYECSCTETVMGNLLSRKLLPGATIVISSREFKAAALPYQARPEKVLTLLGFSESDAEQLFDELVLSDKEKKQSQENPVIDDLRSPWKKLSTDSPLLTGFLTIPVFLMFAAIVYLSTQAPMPVNVTGLLARLLSLLQRSNHVKQACKIRNVIHKLKKVAHEGMVKGSVLFKIDDLSRNNIDPKEVTELLFKVPGKTELSQRLFEEDYLYFFCHQSLQEFLSACFIVEMNLEHFEKFMEKNFHQPRWSVTRRFIFGIIFTLDDGELVQIGNCPQKQKFIFEMLKSDLEESDSTEGFKYKLLEIFYSLYESRQTDFIRSHIQSINLSDVPLGNSEIKLLSYIIQQCMKLYHVNLSSCNLTDNLVGLLLSDLQDGIKINELCLQWNKLSLAILNTFLDKVHVNQLMLHDDYISGNGGLNWKNVSQLQVETSTGRRLKIEKKNDANLMLFSAYVFNEDQFTVKGSLKKNEIMTFHYNDTNGFVIYCIAVAVKYMAPRSVTSEAATVLSSQYVKYEFLERILHWNVNMTISEIVLNCMKVADISPSLVECFTQKYQVKVLNIAVPFDRRDVTKHWMISSTVVKLHVYHHVETSSELHEVAVSLKTSKVKNLRICIEYKCAKDDLVRFIKNCNLKNLTIIMAYIDSKIPRPLQQELHEVAASVHIQLEFLDADRYFSVEPLNSSHRTPRFCRIQLENNCHTTIQRVFQHGFYQILGIHGPIWMIKCFGSDE